MPAGNLQHGSEALENHWGRFWLSWLVAAGGWHRQRRRAADLDAPSPLPALIDAAIAKVKPALVRIRVVSTEYSEGRGVKKQAVGSGARIITKDGYLIASHHVAGHATRMFCTLWNREEIRGRTDRPRPVDGHLHPQAEAGKTREFKFATFGDSAKMRVGDSVLAMGSPMALSQSVTLGILSNTEMVMPRFFGPRGQFRLDGEDVGALVRRLPSTTPRSRRRSAVRS